MSKIVVTGSIAYDHIMSFDGSFEDVILPEQLKHLSVSFYAENHDVLFGGCAGNIAYSLKLLGAEPLILGIAGNDFDRYQEWLNDLGMDCCGIHFDNDNPTAAAHILTDRNGAQITNFSPAAMKTYSGELGIYDLDDVSYGIISPQLPSRMLSMAEFFVSNDISYIFDPGQALPAFRREELKQITDLSCGVILNEYEANLFENTAQISLEDVAAKQGFVVKTLGEKGCQLIAEGKSTAISGYAVSEAKDPTGCGDGFRAGFLSALTNDMQLVDACMLGNVIGSLVVERVGTQRHQLPESEVKKRLNCISFV